MKKLKTEAVARLLNQPIETVRLMARRGSVPWAVYIRPQKNRYGRGQYVYYPERFAQETGIPITTVREVME